MLGSGLLIASAQPASAPYPVSRSFSLTSGYKEVKGRDHYGFVDNQTMQSIRGEDGFGSLTPVVTEEGYTIRMLYAGVDGRFVPDYDGNKSFIVIDGATSTWGTDNDLSINGVTINLTDWGNFVDKDTFEIYGRAFEITPTELFSEEFGDNLTYQIEITHSGISQAVIEPNSSNLMVISGDGTSASPYTGYSNSVGQDSTTAYFETSAPQDGTVYFDITVSSEENYDFARILVENVPVAEISGEASFASNTTVSRADRVRFEYVKDGTQQDGSDAAWLNSLYFTA